jgi:hypothetical protein
MGFLKFGVISVCNTQRPKKTSTDCIQAAKTKHLDVGTKLQNISVKEKWVIAHKVMIITVLIPYQQYCQVLKLHCT